MRKVSGGKAYEVLKTICDFQKKHKRSPSLREIGDIMRFGYSTVQYEINKLERAGCIQRQKYSREIVVVNRHPGFLGEVAEVTSAKRAASGRKGRGADAHKSRKSGKDAGLEARIELVVAMAKARERDAQHAFGSHSSDVIHSFHHVARSSLGAVRVG